MRSVERAGSCSVVSQASFDCEAAGTEVTGRKAVDLVSPRVCSSVGYGELSGRLYLGSTLSTGAHPSAVAGTGDSAAAGCLPRSFGARLGLGWAEATSFGCSFLSFGLGPGFGLRSGSVYSTG